MDKNQATGLILFAAVILIYSIFFASGPVVPPIEESTPNEENLTPQPQVQQQEIPLADSILDSQRVQKFGPLAALTLGEDKEAVLENEVVKISISSKGGKLKEVTLKNYFSWTNEPLVLFNPESSVMSFTAETRIGTLALDEFYFTPELSEKEEEGIQKQVLTLTAQTESGTMIHQYILADGSYVVEKSFEIKGYSGIFTGNSLQVTWNDQIKAQEKDLAESRRKTQVNYYLPDGTYENLGLSDETEEVTVSEPVKWIGFSQRFFTAGIIADSIFQNVSLAQSTPADSSIVRTMKASLSVPIVDGKAQVSYYFGPDQYKTLKFVTSGFEENVDMGYFFVSWVNKYIVVHLFAFLEKYFDSYGIIIILIVLIIKLALSPLTYKSYIVMAKMRVIKPEIDELKEKYGEDPTKMQQEQMKLFSQLGVSPISGCLPLLLQMPFLFAMFFFFPNAMQ